MTVLCWVERDGTGLADGSLRALTFAASLAAAGGERVMAAVFPAPDGAAGSGGVDGLVAVGGSVAVDATAGDQLAELFAGYDVAEVCLMSSSELTSYAPPAWARSLQQLAAAGGGASAVVAAATDRGSEVLAHLGAMTGLPVAANCVSVQPAGVGSWQLTRQRWAGSLLEDALLDASCALLTVAADAVELAGDASGGGAADGRTSRPPVRSFTPTLADADLQVRATESAEQSSGVSLATARVVIGGGRGVGGPEGFAALEDLAGLLGGVLGVSRVVTSQGWRPHRQQVGQTGTKIAPELYLACGISGAIQHMAGCLSAKHIVAVNTDADAPIIAHAEYAVIGDLNEVVPALVDAIRARIG
jgi:electron transfer flavoprotein alpha subunit